MRQQEKTNHNEEQTTRAKILVVEDEPNMVVGLRDNFEFEGYEVITASDGVEGLQRALEESPDLVVLVRKSIRLWASNSARMITSPSHFQFASCWRVSRPCCGAPPSSRRIRSSIPSETLKWICLKNGSSAFISRLLIPCVVFDGAESVFSVPCRSIFSVMRL